MSHIQSIVQDSGEYSSRCGYCGNKRKTSVCHGMWAHSLTVADYQGLLDRGWRRSGKWIYKPSADKTCCPPYTIRLSVDQFLPTREQRRVLRRMNRYLNGDLGDQKPPVRTVENKLQQKDGQDPVTSGKLQGRHACDPNRGTAKKDEIILRKSTGEEQDTKKSEQQQLLEKHLEAAIVKCCEEGQLPKIKSIPNVSVRSAGSRVKAQTKTLIEDLVYTSNIAFVLVAALRKQEVHEKSENVKVNLDPLVVGELLAEKLRSNCVSVGLNVTACKGHLNFSLMKAASSEKPSVDSKVKGMRGIWQLANWRNRTKTTKNKVESRKIPEPQEQTAAVLKKVESNRANAEASQHRQLEETMMRSSFVEEEFQLYRKYQMKVHGDDESSISASSYSRFLVDSPLIYEAPDGTDSIPPSGFGSFHQQYRIDGRLVAVGVVDVLPSCLSSKYLFWDPDMAFLSLGKYSALQEIHWVQKMHTQCPSLAHYYLGFYIHTCPKMKYKAAYSPSELLCPLRLRWVPYSSAIQRLEKCSAVALSDPPGTFASVHDNGQLIKPSPKKSSKTESSPTTDSLSLTSRLIQLAESGEDKNVSDEQLELQALSEWCDVDEASQHSSSEEEKNDSDSDEEMNAEESKVSVEKIHRAGKNSDESRDSMDTRLSSPAPLMLTEQEEVALKQQIKEGIKDIPLLVDGSSCSFKDLGCLLPIRRRNLIVEQLSQYFKLAGPELALRMGYSIS